MSSTSNHPELHRAEKLLDECQFREALAIVIRVEEQGDLNQEDNLYSMWLKMHIRGHGCAMVDCLKISELVYQESYVSKNRPFQYDALFWKGIGLIFYLEQSGQNKGDCMFNAKNPCAQGHWCKTTVFEFFNFIGYESAFRANGKCDFFV